MTHRRALSESSISRKGPNRKAAAQRMIRFMSNQSGGGDEEDDLDLDPTFVRGGNAARPPLPMATSPMRSSPGGRRPLLGSRTPQPFRSSRTRSMDQSELSRVLFSSQSNQAPTSGVPGENNQPESRKDKRYTCNEELQSNQAPTSGVPGENQPESRKDKRYTCNEELQSNQAPTSGVLGENQPESRKDKRGSTNYRESGYQRPASVLQDELDNLLEENECLLQKLRFAEENIEELEARARQLEKQVVRLGQGGSVEARLLSRQI